MLNLPKDPKAIRSRIRSYERSLRAEQQEYGYISDGYGKRYLLGALYLLMDDLDGALAHFAWFQKTFEDDSGDPMHLLCWALALYRAGDLKGAERQLRRLMLANLYIVPYLLEKPLARLSIWHGSNLAEPGYASYIPSEVYRLWDDQARQWLQETYTAPELERIRARYIEIYAALLNEPVGPRRTQLVNEAFALRYGE